MFLDRGPARPVVSRPAAQPKHRHLVDADGEEVLCDHCWEHQQEDLRSALGMRDFAAAEVVAPVFVSPWVKRNLANEQDAHETVR